MYVYTYHHNSKTWGLSSVLNVRMSSTQVRRPTSHEPTSPEQGANATGTEGVACTSNTPWDRPFFQEI